MKCRWLKVHCSSNEELNGTWDLEDDEFLVDRAVRASYICFMLLDGYIDDDMSSIIDKFADDDRMLSLKFIDNEGDIVTIQKS